MTAQISVQLYSLRDESARDFPAVLERLGRIGYAGVETAGLHDLAPGAFRRCCDQAGLAVSSAHIPLPKGDSAHSMLDVQQEVGCDTVIVAMLPPESFATLDAVRSAADDLTAAFELTRSRGLRLGYHNHWWEFETELEGRSAHAQLLERLPPEVFAEIDTYWARVGGVDPARLVAELGARVPYIHVKDGPADGPRSAMTAVGEGAIDVRAVTTANDHVEWHVVELDRCATDVFDAIEKSYGYLVGNGLSRGRV